MLYEQINRGGDLAADHDGASHKRHVWVLLQSVVQSDDVKDVQQLTLVFVDPLHLSVTQVSPLSASSPKVPAAHKEKTMIN